MIIWGSRGLTSTLAAGTFACPECKAQRGYEKKQMRRFFTLYFIPLFPTETLGDWIECARCHAKYNDKVLENRLPPAAQEPTPDAPVSDAPVPGAADAPAPVRYAGFWRRFVALLIDTLLLVVVLAVVGGILAAVLGSGDGEPPPWFDLLPLAAIVGWWLYYALMESSASQGTLGKLALRIKVTGLDGQPIGFGRATGRTFAKAISGFILYTGYLMAAFTQRKQALHDLIAECLVVRK